MNQTAKNYDSVRPHQRARVERRSKRARKYRAMFFMPMVAVFVALFLLVMNDVRWRDTLAGERDARAKEVGKLKAELAMRRGDPQAKRCIDYNVHMEGWDVTHCTKPAARM